MQNHLAGGIDGNFVRAVETNRNDVGIRRRRDGEIVFELLLIAVVGQIDARINFSDAHLGKCPHAGLPARRIVANQVIDFAGQFLRAGNLRPPVRAHELHPHRPRRECARRGHFAENELRRVGRNQELGIAPARDELRRGVHLPLVGLKIKWLAGRHHRRLRRRRGGKQAQPARAAETGEDQLR